MRNRLRTWPIAFLATVVISSMCDTAWSWGDGRSAVAGRQQIQAELAVAMADGALSKWEMYSIIRKGKKVLPPDELQGLQRRLDRLYGRGSSVPVVKQQSSTVGERFANGLGEFSRAQFSKKTPVAPAGLIASSQGEPTRVALLDLPAEPEEVGSPFKDEPVPEGIPHPYPDGVEEAAPMSVSQHGPECGSQCGLGCVSGPCSECGSEPCFGCATEGVTEVFSEGSGVVYEGFGGPMFPLRHRVGILAGNLGGLAAVGLANTFFGHCSASVCELPDIRFLTSVDAFKGPVDLDNLNGNFGFRYAINAGFPMARLPSFNFQAGTSAILTNFHGTQFTGERIRSQSFTTVGMSQRLPWGANRLKYGFAYDWLYDRYYWPFRMSQWRVKLAYEWSPCTEFGMQVAIPNDGDNATLQHGLDPFSGQPRQATIERFAPVAQGSLYYSRDWSNGSRTTAWLGIVEEPGQFVVGGDLRMPLSSRWSFVGNANFVQPSSSGSHGQDEEMWNLSLGFELMLGGGNTRLRNRNTPMFSLADNSTFAIRRF